MGTVPFGYQTTRARDYRMSHCVDCQSLISQTARVSRRALSYRVCDIANTRVLNPLRTWRGHVVKGPAYSTHAVISLVKRDKLFKLENTGSANTG
jgi:hypothetical protein